ncbi:MAG: hypothetical protein ACI4TX_04550 [Christensenellales bacterium]
MESKNDLDFRFETIDESRDFHSKRRAFVIYKDTLYFTEKGNSMSHWEFCSNKFNLTKSDFNELTRGYYMDGNIVFYKDNFIYDDKVIQDGLKYINQIKNILNISNVKIYFGVIIGNVGENWQFDYYYGESLHDNTIIKKG